MVEINTTIDLENRTATIESDKNNIKYVVVKKRDQSALYSITVDIGNTPKELSGRYTTIHTAVKAVETYLKNYKESHAAKSERLAKYREERKNAKTQSDDSQ